MRASGVAIALAARKHADLLEDFVVAEQEAAEQSTKLRHSWIWARRRSGRRACVRSGPIPYIDLARNNPAARCGPACRAPDVSGSAPASSLIMVDFPAAVHAPRSANAIAASVIKLGAAEDVLLSIALRNVLELGGDCRPPQLGLRKLEMDGPARRAELPMRSGSLSQLLDAHLHLFSLLVAVDAEAIDERFQLFDAIALVACTTGATKSRRAAPLSESGIRHSVVYTVVRT